MSSDVCISVVIPTYNYADRLPRALRSVLEQQESNVEVIVIDDGSTDHTSYVLSEALLTWPGLIVIKQANAGAAAARNHGVRLSSGNYLLMLDADDELLPGSLALLKSAVAQYPDAGLFLAGCITQHEDGRERQRSSSTVKKALAKKLIQRYLLKKRISISHGCSLFRRNVIEACPYPEYLRSGEDLAVFAYALATVPVVSIKQPVARINKHSNSLRHQSIDEDPQAIVESVFAHLPESCQSLRPAYLAQRQLSLFRRALLAGNIGEAKCLYLKAFKTSPRQALRLTHVRKALRLFLGFVRKLENKR